MYGGTGSAVFKKWFMMTFVVQEVLKFWRVVSFVDDRVFTSGGVKLICAGDWFVRVVECGSWIFVWEERVVGTGSDRASLVGFVTSVSCKCEQVFYDWWLYRCAYDCSQVVWGGRFKGSRLRRTLGTGLVGSGEFCREPCAMICVKCRDRRDQWSKCCSWDVNMIVVSLVTLLSYSWGTGFDPSVSWWILFDFYVRTRVESSGVWSDFWSSAGALSRSSRKGICVLRRTHVKNLGGFWHVLVMIDLRYSRVDE